MAPMVLPSWNSFFLATQGPMKMTRALGSFSLIRLPIITMGDGVWEMYWARSG